MKIFFPLNGIINGILIWSAGRGCLFWRKAKYMKRKQTEEALRNKNLQITRGPSGSPTPALASGVIPSWETSLIIRLMVGIINKAFNFKHKQAHQRARSFDEILAEIYLNCRLLTARWEIFFRYHYGASIAICTLSLFYLFRPIGSRCIILHSSLISVQSQIILINPEEEASWAKVNNLKVFVFVPRPPLDLISAELGDTPLTPIKAIKVSEADLCRRSSSMLSS